MWRRMHAGFIHVEDDEWSDESRWADISTMVLQIIGVGDRVKTGGPRSPMFFF